MNISKRRNVALADIGRRQYEVASPMEATLMAMTGQA